MSNLVFVYGTLKASEPNHHVLQNGGEGINEISPSERDQFQPGTFHCKVSKYLLMYLRNKCVDNYFVHINGRNAPVFKHLCCPPQGLPIKTFHEMIKNQLAECSVN